MQHFHDRGGRVAIEIGGSAAGPFGRNTICDQKAWDELSRRDRLGLEAGVAQYVEMRVLGDDPLGLGGPGLVAEGQPDVPAAQRHRITHALGEAFNASI